MNRAKPDAAGCGYEQWRMRLESNLDRDILMLQMSSPPLNSLSLDLSRQLLYTLRAAGIESEDLKMALAQAQGIYDELCRSLSKRT